MNTNITVPKRDASELTNLANKITTDRRDMLAQDTDEIYKTIVHDSRPKVREAIFIQYFLEPFTNFSINKTMEFNSPDLARWIDIAGSFYGEVDLVDEKGLVVCTCPPIMKPLAIDSELENVNFTNIARDFISRSNHFTASGTNYLYGAINYISQSLHEDTTDSANKWGSILTYYNNKVNGKKSNLLSNDKPLSKPVEDLTDYMEF